MAGNYFSEDTIAAIATSLVGDGGVGIIRLSGPRALECARLVTRGLDSAKPRFLHRLEVVASGSGQVLDDGLGVYFPSGESFTGEEVVELQLHGGRFLLQTVLQQLLLTGHCRLALPGEFSFRAVRSGKLSLSKASALKQLIEARSLFEVRAARRSMGQSRLKEFDGLAEKIRGLLAQTELSIDFIDQDVEVISAERLRQELVAMVSECDGLLNQLRAAQHVARGLLVVLAGRPNAGKSTLFNTLLSEDRAIVSEEAGTTRDVITEEIALGAYKLRLADTAGLRDAPGQVEKEGVVRAEEAASDAALVLHVIDATVGAKEVMAQAALLTTKARRIIVLNKCDQLGQPDKTAIERVIFDAPVVNVSALSGRGLSELFLEIEKNLDLDYGVAKHGLLPTEFQLQMLLECRDSLVQGLEQVTASGLANPELLSVSLNAAAKALSDLVGETTPDTVLTKIFSEFCIGK